MGWSLSLVSLTSVPSALAGKVEEHPAFGRGAVRAARVTRILQDPSWNWSGFLMLYTVVAVLGVALVVMLNETDALHVVRWVLAVLGLSGVPTLLAFLFQVHLKAISYFSRLTSVCPFEVGVAYCGILPFCFAETSHHHIFWLSCILQRVACPRFNLLSRHSNTKISYVKPIGCIACQHCHRRGKFLPRQAKPTHNLHWLGFASCGFAFRRVWLLVFSAGILLPQMHFEKRRV